MRGISVISGKLEGHRPKGYRAKGHRAKDYRPKGHKQNGFILAELLVYVTIFSLFLTLAVVSIHSVTNEQRQFDHTSRLFYYHLKRTQLADLAGSTGDDDSIFNTVIVYNEEYVTNMYEELWGKDLVKLPPTMTLKINVRRSNNLDLGAFEGQNNVSSLELYDKELKKGRKYIFSQQTARIRWEDVAY
ncbi:MAG: type II secretion system protein [Veillonella sp.]|uniref:type II secretion system protein n=1 Tax=Veillonella sp. TaxID=1926307 RepID=UPI0025E1B636|nr:type II secretion system protein [Veillonella sp.]MBS4913886.1 type II secretion system protein [Veillonella sp.]